MDRYDGTAATGPCVPPAIAVTDALGVQEPFLQWITDILASSKGMLPCVSRCCWHLDIDSLTPVHAHRPQQHLWFTASATAMTRTRSISTT